MSLPAQAKKILDGIRPFIIPISILAIALACYLVYRHTRRMTAVGDLPSDFRDFTFKGFVCSVGDGDGFRAVHVPLLRSVAACRTSGALPVRLAGIDAPEVRLFGRPEQPFAQEAKGELRSLILNRKVWIEVLDVDQYGRIVAMVYVRRWLWRMNVNVEMVRRGLACVYTGAGASYGGVRAKLVEEESKARRRRIGIWSDDRFETPMEFKRRFKASQHR